MPGSITSVFGEAEGFEAALRADGVAGLLITGRGQFRTRLTQIALHRAHLAAVEEAVTRIAFVAVPAGTILVSWPRGERPAPVWAGIKTRAGELLTFCPGNRLHTRNGGPCRWDMLRLPEKELLSYGRALGGGGFGVPPAPAVWRPAPAAHRQLTRLHRAAIRMAEARSSALTDAEAAHGLEQQLIHALIERLSSGSASEETPAAARHRNLVARFEDLLMADPSSRMADICMALGGSGRLLRVLLQRAPWGWVRAAIFGSAECSKCTTPCERKIRIPRASLR
jgi:hypothetical protein